MIQRRYCGLNSIVGQHSLQVEWVEQSIPGLLVFSGGFRKQREHRIYSCCIANSGSTAFILGCGVVV